MSQMLPKEDPTYSEIVWKQFTKRLSAYYALWGVITLALIAIYCPLLISNKPFLDDFLNHAQITVHPLVKLLRYVLLIFIAASLFVAFKNLNNSSVTETGTLFQSL